MYYAPHKLQKRTASERRSDEYGRPLSSSAEGWVDVCPCRCDESSTKEIILPDGKKYQPSFHIVCEGLDPDFTNGDYIRCLRSDGSIKGEGKALNVKKLNFLEYAEAYI